MVDQHLRQPDPRRPDFRQPAPRRSSTTGSAWRWPAIVGTLCFPWQILDNLFVFLGYYGAFLSAIGGIMVADYYLIRRRRLNVPDLYRLDGQYRYAGGFNPAGLVAWLVAGGCRSLVLAVCGADRLPGRPRPLHPPDAGVRAAAHPQAEIDSGFSDRFLATSRGESWSIVGGVRRQREDL